MLNHLFSFQFLKYYEVNVIELSTIINQSECEPQLKFVRGLYRI